MQCNRAISVAPAVPRVLSAPSTSSSVDAPVDNTTGLPVRATRLSNGVLVMSAEAIL